MKRKAILGLVLAIVTACGSGEDEGGADASSAAGMDEAPVDSASIGTAVADEGAAGSAAAEEGAAVMSSDEAPAVRNWVLLEFVEPVGEADLEWLRENGFAVDTVMGEKLVRGWLEKAEGGEVIAGDPRIARVSAQAR